MQQIKTQSTHLPVSVVIPTYNGLALLKKHLPSVIDTMRNGDELVIIEDAGTDQSSEWLKKYLVLNKITDTEEAINLNGKVTINNKLITTLLIQNKINMRFTQSCNRAVSESKYDLIFLLNNDVSPEKDALNNLVSYFATDEDSSLFGVGCFEYEDEAKTIISGKNKLWFDRGLFSHNKADDFESGLTAWISGGSGLFSKPKWLELRGFDPAFYPAYWEDVDLSFRAQKLGWKTVFAAEAKVFHQHESTNAQEFSDTMTELSWQHADYFTRKHATSLQMIKYCWWRPFWWWQRMKARQK